MLSYMTNQTDLIQHHLGFFFVPIPFLWHYDDFALPFPVYKCLKVSMYKMRHLIGLDNFKAINTFNDHNCEFYILAQYKDNKSLYHPSTDPREIYVSYHTWLYKCVNNDNTLDDMTKDQKFLFQTALKSIDGQIANHKVDKPHHGIPIDKPLQPRKAKIHKHHEIIRFSGASVCNFDQMSDNCVFLSIIKDQRIFEGERYNKINKKSCVVLHIFRNVYDNNPQDKEYQSYIKKYMS